MAGKKKQTAKQKELARLKRQIRATEKRGYRYSQEFKESLQNLSWQKLRRITTQELYKKATALSESGDIVSGIQKRKEEDSISGKKSAETRRKVKQAGYKTLKEYQQAQKQQYDSDFDRRRREQDRIDRERAEKFQQGQLVYDQVQDLINHYPTVGSYMLQTALNSEISRYGQDAVVRSIAEAPERAIQLSQEIVYYEDSSEAIHSALLEFINIIRGTIPTAEEARETGDSMDAITSM